MICSNCGAQIEDNALLCPYCGCENEAVAKKEQSTYLQNYKQKTSDLVTLPHKIVKKSTKYILMGGLALIGIFLICLIINWIISDQTARNALAKQNQQLAQLEEYYNCGDYKSMTAYLEELDVHGATYEKYHRVATLYDNTDWHLEAIQEEADLIQKADLTTKDVATSLSYTLDELAAIYQMEQDGFPYGEETGVLYIRELYMNALEEHMLLTEAEIDAVIANYDSETLCLELADTAIRRIKEAQ